MLNFYKLNTDYLKFTGSERLDLINRLSTNEVNSLPVFETSATVLTSDKGRIIDLLDLYNLGEVIFAACSLNNSSKIIAHLDKYTIMDDFIVKDLSGSHSTILFTGENISAFFKEFSGTDITELADGKFIVTKDYDAIITLNKDAMGGLKFIYSNDNKDYWESRIFSEENMSKFKMKEIEKDDFEILRIKLGIPEYGKEMTEQTNPLECGLDKYVSFTKGCYIGQEVIARLNAYDKISKHLVGLIIDGALDLNKDQYKISLEGKECGYVTSAVADKNSRSQGLGFIKTIFLDFNKEYKIKLHNGELNCRINKLPFN